MRLYQCCCLASNSTNTQQLFYLESPVSSLAYGYDLIKYIDGTLPCPYQTSSSSSSTTSNINLEYSLWKRQDQFIFNAILASSTERVAPLIASCSTSKQAWDKLERLYSSRSKSRVLTLKECLTRPRGANQPVADYLNNLRSIADELTLIDSPITDDDLVVHILNNIGKEFIIGGVRARETSIAFGELYDKLVDFEEYLKRDETLAQTPAITANMTTKNYTKNSYPNRNIHQNRGQPSSPSLTPQTSNRHHTNSNDQLTRNSFNQFPRKRRGYKGCCQLCNQKGHTAKDCTNFTSHRTNLTAHHTTTSPLPSSQWLVDSAASHHITSDLQNLSIKHPYHGNDIVVIGNGVGLSISHTGSLSLDSPSKTFSLHDILYVPSMHKNLISVSQFCMSNNTSIEFFPTFL